MAVHMPAQAYGSSWGRRGSILRTRFGLRLERRSFFRNAYRMLQECHEAQWQTIRKRMLTKTCRGNAGGLALLPTLELAAASLAPVPPRAAQASR